MILLVSKITQNNVTGYELIQVNTIEDSAFD